MTEKLMLIPAFFSESHLKLFLSIYSWLTKRSQIPGAKPATNVSTTDAVRYRIIPCNGRRLWSKVP